MRQVWQSLEYRSNSQALPGGGKQRPTAAPCARQQAQHQHQVQLGERNHECSTSPASDRVFARLMMHHDKKNLEITLL